MHFRSIRSKTEVMPTFTSATTPVAARTRANKGKSALANCMMMYVLGCGGNEGAVGAYFSSATPQVFKKDFILAAGRKITVRGCRFIILVRSCRHEVL